MKATRNIIGNAFSLNMINIEDVLDIEIERINPADVPQDCVSIIGHVDTARVISGILGWDVPANRVNYSVESGDVLYIAQYTGPRLPEGATELPEGAEIRFYRISRAVPCGGIETWIGKTAF